MVVTTYLNACLERLSHTHLSPYASQLREQVDGHLAERSHGRTDEWDTHFNQLPDITTQHFRLDTDTVEIGDPSEGALASHLKHFLPWRKGPYQLFDTFIDTEWRSDWKWQRVQPHISDLSGRHVLDIGCGNGYHMLRMLGDGAASALGIDPTRLFLYQFLILKKYAPHLAVELLPLKSEHLPAMASLDTVFSLGVLYHRRSPLDHLTELFSFLRSGGELVLETLIVEGDAQTVLVPEDRYAMMRNVWFLPSPGMLEIWLKKAGFKHIRTVDVNQTSLDEQRATEWMQFQSLKEFLDPNDISLTAEGYPAPKRAITIAEKP